MTALAPASAALPPLANDAARLLRGVSVGLLAAGIGATYVVFARWGIQRGASPLDLTALRFGVAGLILLPLLLRHLAREGATFLAQWRVWLSISLLAGTPFGFLMFGALQFAPASHAAVFPFAAMSIAGMILAAIFLGDRLTARRAGGIAVVLIGLVLVSGIDGASFTALGLLGDGMFIVAGALWSGFGIILRKRGLDPLLATAVIAVSALASYIPVYLWATGGAGLLRLAPDVLLIEALVQGVIAGAGTLYTYARMVTILGPSRAAIFPALAPGLAALLAWPVLDMAPGAVELIGLATVIAGLLWAVTGSRRAPVRR